MRKSSGAALRASSFAMLVIAGVADAAEQGTTTGFAAYKATGEVQEYSAETLVWTGTFVGASVTDAGDGPLHNSAWDCTGEVILREGMAHLADGFCEVVDADGDAISLYWQRTDVPAPPAEPKTKGTYIGGTGKYAGIAGYYTFACRAGGTICTITSGEYTIP
jgi:hypothetical protein